MYMYMCIPTCTDMLVVKQRSVSAFIHRSTSCVTCLSQTKCTSPVLVVFKSPLQYQLYYLFVHTYIANDEGLNREMH